MKRKNHKVMILMTMATLLAAMTVFAPQAMAMNHIWSKSFGGIGTDRGYSVATDPSGNVLITGEFYGTVNFGGGNLSTLGGSSEAIFLAKYAADGTHVWSKSFGGNNFQFDFGRGVTTDASGNVLITGVFYGTVNFGGGNLTGTYDIFLAKYAANGTHVWSKSFGASGVSDAVGWSVATDPSGNVLVIGHFGGTMNLGGGNLTATSSNDHFLAKYDAAGNHVWSKSLGRKCALISHSVATDASGNVLVTGCFIDTMNLGGGILTASGDDIFLAKYAADGTHVWSKSFGSTATDLGRGVTTDASGNVLLTGYFQNTVNFGGGNLTSVGTEDIFLAKYDAAGNHVWSKSFGGVSHDRGYSVATDASENVLFTGTFESPFTDFGGGSLAATGIFLAKYDKNGTHLGSKNFTASIPISWSVATDASGNVLATGAFQGTGNFGGGNLTSVAGDDIFIVKYDGLADPVITSVNSTTTNGSYNAGDTVSVTVTFSEAVNVTGGPPQITLETGTTDAVVNYTSGSGTAALTFTYTVGAGHTSADLDYVNTASLALNGSTVKNLAGTFDAVLTLPTPGAANSLGANKAIVIDTTAPTLAQVTAVPTPGNDATPDYTFSSTEAGTITYTGACSSATTAAVNGNNTVTFSTLADGAHSNCQISVTDTAGNASGNLAVSSFTVDASAPTVTINQAQADPATTPPINFTVVFSESVTGFADADVTLSGTAGATTGTVTGSGTTYNVAVSGMTSAGTVIASIGAGVAADAAGNGNAASTSTDNTVTFTPPPASVISINRVVATPTNAASLQFTVTFSESMSGIDTGDFALALTGTAAGTIASVSAASGTSITVTVNTITGDGTLGLNLTDDDSITNSVSVPLGGAGAGNGSFTGQTYTLDHTAPTVVLTSTATNPTGSSPFSVTATFSESVTGFALGDIGVTNGSAGNFSGSGTTYTFDITPVADGPVTVNIPANAAQDSVGYDSTAATALSRTYDHTLVTPAYGSNPASGSTINVGTANVGSPISKALQVSETGNATLNVTSHTLGGTNPGDFSVTPATLSIADGGAAQDFTIQCTPSADGARTATLTVNHNAAGSPATYTLECTGTTAPPVSASVSIVRISNITGSTVFANGTAWGDGIGERGFYWWIPPTAENHFGGSESGLIPEGYGAGSFSLTLTGLKPGNTYHVKAYIKVGGQIITSDEQLFTTPTTGATGKTAPTVSTTSCTLNADGTVTAAGQITDVGTSPVNVYGFLYAKHPAPFTGDNGDAALAMWDKAPVYQSLSFTGTIRNLAPGKWYLRAYAHNDNPDSDAAQTASLGYGEDCTFTVPGDVIVPTAPTGLTGVAKSATQADLSWTDNSSDEIGFRVYRNGVLITTTGAGVTTFSDTGVTCGTTYSYEVKAANADGDSAGITVTVSIPACADGAPTAPTGLTGVAKSQTQIDLSWTDNSSNETGFRIFRNGIELLPSPKGGVNLTAFSDTGLTCGTAYTYIVKAVNAAGDSAGVTATATTSACASGTPAAPGGLTATAKSATQIDLSWTDNSSNETGFRIFRNGVELTPSPKVGAGVTTFSDTGLTCGTTYTYVMKAVNIDGDSAATPAATVTTPACASGAPVAPGGLTATAISQTQINLSWTDNSDNETGFRIFRNGVELLPSPKAGAGVKTFSDTGLTCGMTYTYIVKAVNAAGDSAGVTASATVQACPYVPPSYDTGSSYYAPPVNQAPVADILYVSTEMNNAITDVNKAIPLELYSVVTQPQHGTLTGTAPDLSYTPDQGFVGTDSFTYRIWDGTAYSAPAPVQIIVRQNITEVNKAIPLVMNGTDPDSDFFTLLMKPLTYSVVTQPQHGTLTGTAPNLSYTPDQGFVGTDSFTYRIYDGTAYSAPATVQIIVHQNSHANIGDKYEIDIFCAEYEGTKYGFRLNLTPVAADPTAYYWKGDVLTFGKAYSDSKTKGCIPVGKNLHLNVASALFQGTLYQFTLNFTPVAADPFGFYWKMDLDTLKTH